ncbi:type III pantothenate kinase [Aquimonas sp.]|jgi:type III pantothenate kinase|uniref:type III pantothenate kinase n=1 Tax=Aquimonas sp. TaxID=1872588 RepID=UPI0037BE751E
MAMKLLLDLGNTRLKWVLADDRLGIVDALGHAGPDFLPALEQRLRALPPVQSVHLVAVTAEALTTAVIELVMRTVQSAHWPVRRHRSAAAAAGLRCAYADPQRLGADRWLALRGALKVSSPPLLVVNAGTALTLDAVAADGQHLGGLILAGIASMRDGLLQRAPHLDSASTPPARDQFWTQDTLPAVAQAPWQAAAGLVERGMRHLRTAAAIQPMVLLAGGDAEILAGLLDCEVRVEPNLVLLGLLEAAIE